MKIKALDKQLAIYSTAAGVVVLGVAGADATIQYTAMDVTMDTNNPSFFIDFDDVGSDDIQFRFLAGSSYKTGLVVVQNSVNIAMDTGSVANLSADSPITSNISWGVGEHSFFFAYPGGATGSFEPSAPGYIGFRFDPSWGSDWQYGWVHIDSIAADFSSYHIAGYAYEDDMKATPITAGAVPEPGSLALLASGAAGIGILRRRYKKL